MAQIWIMAFALIAIIMIAAVTANKTPDKEATAASRGDRGCVSCQVKGNTYKGHSRFQYEDDCKKYRCVCRCDGSYECPARYTINICDDSLDRKDGEKENNPPSRTGAQHSRERNHRQTGRCTPCVVDGKEHPGHSYFTRTADCWQTSNCICYCNGTWVCPAERAKNICEEGANRNTNESRKTETRPSGTRERPRSRCQNCTVDGKSFLGNAYFEIERDCFRYKYCVCSCNGSWNCPDSHAENICESTEAPQEREIGNENICRSCKVHGKTYQGNTYFDTSDDCIEYSRCICSCNGSWSCPSSRAKNICVDGRLQPNNTRQQNNECQECQIRDTKFPPNKYFQTTQGCIEYRNCICYCNGSWYCPSSGARNKCSVESQLSGIEGDGNSRTAKSNCHSCLAYGKYFKGNNYFDVVSGCTQFRNCICRCDGTWDCNSRFSENICTKRPLIESTTRSQEIDQCSFCSAKNKIVKGNSVFELTDGCIKFENCLCRCDGTWECPSRYAKRICHDPSDQKLPTGAGACANCLARGKIIKGNSTFDLINGCVMFKDCQCRCDGSWDCFQENTQNICVEPQIDANQCRSCKSKDGTLHPANSSFTLVENCIEYSCDCFCNGSWSCPGKRSKWICKDQCLDCDVEGKKITNGTVFQHKTGCLEYTCNCHCNGSWNCPGNTVKNTCEKGVRDNCNKCTISPSKQYPGESDFVLEQGCLHYQCRCNCDGSYNCPGKDARNVCRGEVLGGCRSCVVSESEIHRGDTDFNLRKGCLNFQCRCNCDGSWSCPAQKTRDVCVGEVPGGCRVCRVTDNEIYRANSVFDLKKGCIHYKCKCNCDGGWTCPGKDARDVCKGEVPGGCRSCHISENEYYPANTNFEMIKNCIHYKCQCNCDGGYYCPGKDAKRVCYGNNETDAQTQAACRTCKVSESEEFLGNTSFRLERGCISYQCKCKCDGSWDCPPKNTINSCNDNVRQNRQNNCKECRITNQVYPGNSDFKFTRQCYQFDCNCNCNGRWSCNHKDPTNICKLRQQKERSRSFSASQEQSSRNHNDFTASNKITPTAAQRGRSISVSDIGSGIAEPNRETEDEASVRYYTTPNCRKCYVDGKIFQANQTFSLQLGCKKFRNCFCHCNGRWQCAEEINNCGSRRTSVNNQGSRKIFPGTEARFTGPPRVDSGEGRAWVYVDENNRRVQDGRTRTGGGYVSVDANYKSKSTFGKITEQNKSVKVNKTDICQPCLVDSKTYRAGAVFDMRRSCVIYKCSCLCSGSYRCRLTSDDSCTDKERGGTCRNCIYKGMVFPGNMGFNVRDSCGEKQCTCNCNGTHSCSYTTPAKAGCSNENFQGGNFYPVQMGTGPVRKSYITNTGRAVYTSVCATCEGGSGAVVHHMPVFPASGDRRRHKTNNVNTRNSETCGDCMIEGEIKQGNSSFSFEKDCIEFNCYCACGGSWKCSGQLSVSCSPAIEPKRPEYISYKQRCRSCNVQGTYYPSGLKFSLRQGCFEYKLCSCDCKGSWHCPHQQPTNLCPSVPERPPERPRGSIVDPQRVREKTYTIDKQYVSRVDVVGERIISDDNGRKYEQPEEYRERLNTGKEMTERNNFNLNRQPCKKCKINVKEFVPERQFQLKRGCFQYSCQCHCNGTYTCPRETVKSTCLTDASENQSVLDVVSRSQGMTLKNGCKKCYLDGQEIDTLTSFVRLLGCNESLCQCKCNGEAECPVTASVNVCEISDTLPMERRTGCVVGRRTHYTRVFALIEDCQQRTCICHDNGTWTCRRRHDDIKVC